MNKTTGFSIFYRFVAGVIGRERIPTFERMLWRVCRGNVFLRQADIEDPLEDPTTVSAAHKSDFVKEVRRFCFLTCRYTVSTGWSGPQVGLHHIFPRRPAEESSQENLRGVRESAAFIMFLKCWWPTDGFAYFINLFLGSEQHCTHVPKPHRKGKRCWQGWMLALMTCKW